MDEQCDAKQMPRRLFAVAVTGRLGGTAVDPALDRESCGIYHADGTEDAQQDIKYAGRTCSCNSAVMKHGLNSKSVGL